MISPGSRYEQAEQLFAQAHVYDESGVPTADENGVVIVDARNTSYMLATLPLPDPPDLEYVAKVTDSFDTLASQYLGDPARWWAIADANPGVRYPLDLVAGTILRMPS